MQRPTVACIRKTFGVVDQRWTTRLERLQHQIWKVSNLTSDKYSDRCGTHLKYGPFTFNPTANTFIVAAYIYYTNAEDTNPARSWDCQLSGRVGVPLTWSSDVRSMCSGEQWVRSLSKMVRSIVCVSGVCIFTNYLNLDEIWQWSCYV